LRKKNDLLKKGRACALSPGKTFFWLQTGGNKGLITMKKQFIPVA
jgi:hypothetical protein